MKWRDEFRHHRPLALMRTCHGACSACRSHSHCCNFELQFQSLGLPIVALSAATNFCGHCCKKRCAAFLLIEWLHIERGAFVHTDSQTLEEEFSDQLNFTRVCRGRRASAKSARSGRDVGAGIGKARMIERIEKLSAELEFTRPSQWKALE